MTISLLLVVMRILTVTTRSKLEILPVSGAPAAQHERGWHRCTLPAFIPAPSCEPAQSTRASPGLEMPPDLTLLLAGWAEGLAEQEEGFSLSLAPQGAQPLALGTAACWGEPRGGGWGGCRVLEGEEVRAALAWIVPLNKLPFQEKCPWCWCDLPAARLAVNWWTDATVSFP